jgi:hypothetical protein
MGIKNEKQLINGVIIFSFVVVAGNVFGLGTDRCNQYRNLVNQINALTKQRNGVIQEARVSKDPKAGEKAFDYIQGLNNQKQALIKKNETFLGQNKGVRCFVNGIVKRTCWTIDENTKKVIRRSPCS